jgi:L-ascorbate metabolism protein UlaG (beta-lactamase superfamily)
MRIKYLGHAAFLLAASDGTHIITDPYKPGCFNCAVNYGPIEEQAEFVTVSHDHLDHNYTDDLPGSPRVIKTVRGGRAGVVKVTGFATFHDESRGRERGSNIVFVFEDEGLRLAHLGDLGHIPAEQAEAIGAVHVVLLPVGGYFTIGPDAAHRTAALLRAKVIIPMHFATKKTSMPIVGVDRFTEGQGNVKLLGVPEVEVTAGSLPESPEIWVLEHAL